MTPGLAFLLVIDSLDPCLLLLLPSPLLLVLAAAVEAAVAVVVRTRAVRSKPIVRVLLCLYVHMFGAYMCARITFLLWQGVRGWQVAGGVSHTNCCTAVGLGWLIVSPGLASRVFCVQWWCFRQAHDLTCSKTKASSAAATACAFTAGLPCARMHLSACANTATPSCVASVCASTARHSIFAWAA